MADDEIEEMQAQEGKDQQHNKDKVAVLAIAYHNMGVEQEFLRSYPAAILSYKKAVNYAEKNLGPDDGITQNLRSVYENAKSEVSDQSKNNWLYFDFSLTWLSSRRERRLAWRARKLKVDLTVVMQFKEKVTARC